MTPITQLPNLTNPLQTAREEMIHQILRFAALLNGLVALLLIFEAVQQGSITSRLVIGLIATGLTWSLAFVKSWPHHVRTTGALLIITLAGANALATSGLAGPGPLMWLFAAIFSLIILGRRIGLLVSLASTLLIGLTGRLVYLNQDQLPAGYLERTRQTVSGESLLPDTLIFVTVSVLLILSLRFIMRTLNQALQEEAALSHALETEAEELEDKINRRIDLIQTGAAINRLLNNLQTEKELHEAATGSLREARSYRSVAVIQAGDLPGAADPTGLLGRVAEDSETPHLVQTGAGWTAAVPITGQNRLIAVLQVENDAPLDEEELFLLTLVGNQLATSLSNARLYNRVEKQAHYQAALQQVSDRLNDAATIQEALQIAGEEIAKALGQGGPGISARLDRYYRQHAHGFDFLPRANSGTE